MNFKWTILLYRDRLIGIAVFPFRFFQWYAHWRYGWKYSRRGALSVAWTIWYARYWYDWSIPYPELRDTS